MNFKRYFISITLIVCALSFSCFAFPKLKAVSVSGGEEHTVVRADNNEVFVTGYGNNGQLGTGNQTNQSVFVRVSKGEMDTSSSYLQNITKLATGWKHSLFLESNNGRVLSCGDNYWGELGNGKDYFTSGYSPCRELTPVWIHAGQQNPAHPDSNLYNIIQVSTGRSGEHSLAIDANGFCYAWGLNNMGQCGVNASAMFLPAVAQSKGLQRNRAFLISFTCLIMKRCYNSIENQVFLRKTVG